MHLNLGYLVLLRLLLLLLFETILFDCFLNPENVLHIQPL